MSPRAFCLLACCTLLPSVGPAEPPRALDPRLVVELVAQEPDIRTPTAIQVDAQGRVWVLENNTHFRPKNYDGPPSDRIVVLDDFGPDGRARKFTTYADDFRDGMGLLLEPGAGGAILSTRSETLRLRDLDGDGRAEVRTTLLKLETGATYPHNGLSGVTRGPDGKLYLGLGENFSNPWTLTGSDGTALHGSDEGAIFRCNADGTGLEWWALGVWNPYGLALDKKGRLFALDNDPSGGSLCRLLHIVRGGDYGYRNRYGRTIDHPFVSWFGTLPGTLPPVCLVGEAPTGIIQYQGEALPMEYRGELLGCTWSEHGVQRFPLKARGLSVESKPEWVVRGGHDFRPSGIAEAQDGSLLVSDWASGSYDVHGKGRVWRVKAAAVSSQKSDPRAPDNNATAHAENLNHPDGDDAALQNLGKDDPFLVHHAIQHLAEEGDAAFLRTHARSAEPKTRLGILLALRRRGGEEGRSMLPQFLTDADGAVRRAALKWIAEDRLTDLQSKLEGTLSGQPSRATFQACLATLQMLTAGKPDPKATAGETVKIALDKARPAELRALALRLLPPEHAGLTVDHLRALAEEPEAAVSIEAVRLLAGRRDATAQGELRRLAGEASAALGLRAEALAGLAHSATEPGTQAVLQAATRSGEPLLAREARRSAGISAASEPEPAEAKAQAALTGAGDAAAGRRLFFHPNGPRCFACHAIEGRGVAVGPDLTNTGRFTSAQLLEAIREPSKEIAPAHTQWHVKMRDGREAFGIDLFEDNKSQVTLIDATGVKTKYKIEDIASREPMPISLMPPGLDAPLSSQELRDLLAFLREPRD